MTEPADPKYKVTMSSAQLGPDGDLQRHEAIDYVPASILDAYTADARLRWQSVVVSDQPDYGPAGIDGATADLPHLES